MFHIATVLTVTLLQGFIDSAWTSVKNFTYGLEHGIRRAKGPSGLGNTLWILSSLVGSTYMLKIVQKCHFCGPLQYIPQVHTCMMTSLIVSKKYFQTAQLLSKFSKIKPFESFPLNGTKYYFLFITLCFKLRINECLTVMHILAISYVLWICFTDEGPTVQKYGKFQLILITNCDLCTENTTWSLLSSCTCNANHPTFLNSIMKLFLNYIVLPINM